MCVCFSPFSQTFHQVYVLATANALKLPFADSFSLSLVCVFVCQEQRERAQTHMVCSKLEMVKSVKKKLCFFRCIVEMQSFLIDVIVLSAY